MRAAPTTSAVAAGNTDEAGERLTPVFQHRHQAAIVQVRARGVFQHVGQAKAVDHGLQDGVLIAQGEPAGHVHVQFLAVPFELPLVQMAAGETEAHALMLRQFVRMRWNAAALQVGRRAHDQAAQRRAQRHRHHVFGHRLVQAHAGIESLGDDIHQAIVLRQFNAHVGVGLQ